MSLLEAGWGDDEKDGACLNRNYDPEVYANYPMAVRRNLARVDESAIDFDLLEDLVAHVHEHEADGAILVFLPGMGEISELVNRLSGSHRCAATQFMSAWY